MKGDHFGVDDEVWCLDVCVNVCRADADGLNRSWVMDAEVLLCAV